MEDDQLKSFQDGPFIFRLNDNGTGPSLLIQVCLERGWRGFQAEAADSWNLWWRGGIPAPHRRSLNPWQFINHIPKGSSICKKDNLARHLKCMKKVYGSIYDFSPTGYHLPLEYAKLAAECSRGRSKAYSKDDDFDENSEFGLKDQKIWICKPVGQSQGRGIYLFRRLSDLTYDNNTVVQRYIERPLLIGGYKFDLRLYVCIPSYHPLTVYLYREGLARFSTDKFSLNDLHNPFRHLTNSSLNKFGPKYAECKDRIGSGCKWTLRQLRRYLRGLGARDWWMWQRIATLVVLTALAQAAGVPPARNCFEFFGFDVLLDADLRPWLLEVNLSPALANDCDADEIVKKPLLHDLFDLLGLPMRNTGLSLFTVWSKETSKDNSASGSCSDEEEGGEGSDHPINLVKTSNNWRDHSKPELANQTVNGNNRSRNRQTRPTSGPKSPPQPGRNRKQGRPLPAINLTFPKDSQEPISQVLPEETWGRYSVVQRAERSRRRCPATAAPSLMWGNGRDWSAAPSSTGGWIKLFPMEILPPDDGGGGWHTDRDVRAAVGSVARYTKAAKTVEKRFLEADDQQLNNAMREQLQSDIEIWLPEI